METRDTRYRSTRAWPRSSAWIRFRDPEGPNFGGQRPDVRRVDLIAGEVRPVVDRNADQNPTARVVGRFDPATWQNDGANYVIVATVNP